VRQRPRLLATNKASEQSHTAQIAYVVTQYSEQPHTAFNHYVKKKQKLYQRCWYSFYDCQKMESGESASYLATTRPAIDQNYNSSLQSSVYKLVYEQLTNSSSSGTDIIFKCRYKYNHAHTVLALD